MDRKEAQGELHGPIVRLSTKLDGVVRDFNFSRSTLLPEHRRALDEAEELARQARDRVFKVGNDLEPGG